MNEPSNAQRLLGHIDVTSTSDATSGCRDPESFEDSPMKIKNNKEAVIQYVVHKLSELRKERPKNLSVETHNEFKVVLGECFDFNDEMPLDRRAQAIAKALDQLMDPSVVCSQQTLSSTLDSEQTRYLRQPKSNFVLLSRLSVILDARIPAVTTFGGAKIRLTKSIPRGFQWFQTNTSEHQMEKDHPYAWVRVEVEARCGLAAVAIASAELQIYRALWNLVINYPKVSRLSLQGLPSQVNQITLGPKDTIHAADGTQVQRGLYWYRQTYRKPAMPIKIAATADEFVKLLKVAKKAMAKMDVSVSEDGC